MDSGHFQHDERSRRRSLSVGVFVCRMDPEHVRGERLATSDGAPLTAATAPRCCGRPMEIVEAWPLALDVSRS